MGNDHGPQPDHLNAQQATLALHTTSAQPVHAHGAGVDPSNLRPHPLHAELFGGIQVPGADQEDFEADIATHGVVKPVTVTGAGCASTLGTMLSGARRVAACLKLGLLVPVLVRNDLTELDEATIVIRENLADVHTRKLTERQLYVIEAKYAELHGKRRGERSDLKAPHSNVDGSPSKSRRPKTSTVVAKLTNTTANAYVDRAKLFTSPFTTPPLIDAVETGRASRSAAAILLRSVEREFGSSPTKEDVAAGRARVDAALGEMTRDRTNRSKSSQRAKAARKARAPSTASHKNPGTPTPWPYHDVDEGERELTEIEARWARATTLNALRDLAQELADHAYGAHGALWRLYLARAAADGTKVDPKVVKRVREDEVRKTDPEGAIEFAERINELLDALASDDVGSLIWDFLGKKAVVP